MREEDFTWLFQYLLPVLEPDSFLEQIFAFPLWDDSFFYS